MGSGSPKTSEIDSFCRNSCEFRYPKISLEDALDRHASRAIKTVSPSPGGSTYGLAYPGSAPAFAVFARAFTFTMNGASGFVCFATAEMPAGTLPKRRSPSSAFVSFSSSMDSHAYSSPPRFGSNVPLEETRTPHAAR